MKRPTTFEEATEFKRYLQDRVRNAGQAGLPAIDVNNVEILVDAGEYVLALETLATQVYEYDVVLPAFEEAALRELGEEFEVPVSKLLGAE